MGITPGEIAAIREAQADFMPLELQVYRFQVHDGQGEPERWGPAVMGRIASNMGSLWRSVADRYQGLTMYTVTGPYDWDVKEGDHVYDGFGRHFIVRDVRNPQTYHTAKQCLAEGVTSNA